MLLLKRETAIPLPDDLDFSPTTQNTLRRLYIIMTIISGIPMYNIWFGDRLNNASPETTRLRRIRALEKQRLGNSAARQVFISNRQPSSLWK